MKKLMLLVSLVFVGSAFAMPETSKLFLECRITADGVNPNIPRKLKAYINEEERNWSLAYSVAGVSEEKFTLIANGDVYQEKRTRELRSASFEFSDNSVLEIIFSNGVGISKSDNVIFRHLEKAKLTDCKVFE